MEEFSQNLDWGALNWTAIAAVVVFFTSQAISLISTEIGRRRARKMLARALYAEIVALFDTVLRQSESDIQLLDRIDLDEMVGAIVPSEEPRVYNANIDKVSYFPRALVMDIVSLYTTSESINSITENMKSESYKSASKKFKEMGKTIFVEKVIKHNLLVKSVVAQLEKYSS